MTAKLYFKFSGYDLENIGPFFNGTKVKSSFSLIEFVM